MAYRKGIVKVANNGKTEWVFADAAMERNTALPALWGTTIVPITVGTDGSYMNVYRFGKGDYFLEHKHIPHGVDYSLKDGLLDLDLHFLVDTAEDAVIKGRLSLYHIYPGRALGSLAPDIAHNFDIIVTSGETTGVLRNQYAADIIDCSALNANRTIHDEMLIRFERLETADGDTYSGNLDVLHGEIFNPEKGLQWHGS